MVSADENTAVLSSIPRRLLAMLLDAFFLMIPSVLAEHLIPAVGSLVLTFFYFTFFDSSRVRATPGKYLMGIQVTDLSGGRIFFRAAVTRYFMRILSGLFLFLGFAFAFFTRRRQTLHDLVAETIVIRGRVETSLPGAWWEQVKAVFDSQTPAPGGGSQVRIAELERLQALREKGALTEEEFQEQKRRLLSSV